MPEIKCICCGKALEQEKRTTCPQCGYTMYEMPYDRAVMLRSEIVRFIGLVCSQKMDTAGLIWGDKAKDDKRFPDFDKIQEYCCTSEKTDTFLNRVTQSISNIREYVHTPFVKTYKGETKHVTAKCDAIKRQLDAVFKTLEIKVEFPDFKMPALRLEHSEIPDDALIAEADMILDKLDKLTEKIRKFIKLNNIY